MSQSKVEETLRPQETAAATATVANDGEIRLYIPREYYLVPLSTTSAGLGLGFLRGVRQSSLQFLAENAHRPPKTVEEWYFYHKSKNYRVLLGGLKASGREGLRLGAAGALWVGIEQAAKQVGHGVDEWREVVAGVGLAGVVSLAYRLPRRVALQASLLGMTGGSLMTLLRRTKGLMEEESEKKRAERIE